jgi:putative protease
VDGELRPLGDARYLLSPGDLFAVRQIPEIVDIGVSALKIEGRYKDAEYVALTTRAYREAVDEAWAGRAPHLDRAREMQLEQVYSRGLGPFFLTGTDHQAVVRGRAPRHRGVLMGRVARIAGASVIVDPAGAHDISPLKPGDGVVFDAADWRTPEESEEGGRVFAVRHVQGKLELQFANGALDLQRIRRGDLLWRTHDPDVHKAAKPFLDSPAPVRKQPVHVRVVAREGEPLLAEWTVVGTSVTVRSEDNLGPARNRGLDREFLLAQFGRLGNTPYELASLDLDAPAPVFAPSALLNQLRREAVSRLQEAQSKPRRRGADTRVCGVETLLDASPHPIATEPASLHLLVRTPEQLEAAIDSRPASVTLDYLDLYGLKPSIERVRESGVAVRVASPRVLKPGEERIVDFLIGCDCPILVRSTGLLFALRGRPHPLLIGDFSLNAANAVTAAELFALGLNVLTPTHDLNAEQVAALARVTDASKIEAIAYQHLPVFHTEHCVFCRFLSTGKSYRDCGRPCEEHRVALRDDAGRAHPVMADVGCRNTVFGAEAQEASRHLDAWLDAGIRRFRLEFAHESAAQVRAVARLFAETLADRRTAAELGAELRRVAPHGATEGSLYVPEGYLTLPVLQ